MNKCFLVGNLTRDPEVSTTGSGVNVCKFSIAINRNFTNANGEREADFLNIVAWRNLGENCGKYLVKGNKVAVSGSIQTRTYEVEGQKRYATDIVADDVEFLSPKTGGDSSGGSFGGPSGGGSSSGGGKKTAELKPVEDEGLPF
jgi:single-strand DNA-binding protein